MDSAWLCTLIIWAESKPCLTLKGVMWLTYLTQVIICMVSSALGHTPCHSLYFLLHWREPCLLFFLPKHKMHFMATLMWNLRGIFFHYFKWQKGIVMVICHLTRALRRSVTVKWPYESTVLLSSCAASMMCSYCLRLLCFVSQIWDWGMKSYSVGNSKITL